MPNLDKLVAILQQNGGRGSVSELSTTHGFEKNAVYKSLDTLSKTGVGRWCLARGKWGKDAEYEFKLVDRLLPEDASRKRPGWVYFCYQPDTHRCKIGWTENDPQKRISDSTFCPGALNLWGLLLAESKGMELILHKHFSYLHVRGEWFAVDKHLHDFAQFHTYKTTKAVQTRHWQEVHWDAWNRLSGDRSVRQLVSLCQVDPVHLVRRYPDPLKYFYYAVKPRLLQCVGWEARECSDDFFKTELAYDVVYEMCVDLLPC